MATKKHSKRTTSDKTSKGRPTTDDKDQVVPADTPTPAEPVPVEAAEPPSTSTSETTEIDTPVSGEAENIASTPALPNQATPLKKLSALDAAASEQEKEGQLIAAGDVLQARCTIVGAGEDMLTVRVERYRIH